MLARWLRWCLLAEVAMVAAGVTWAVRAGSTGGGQAMVVAPVVLPALYAIAVAAAYGIARLHASPPPPGVPAGRLVAWAGGVGEWLVAFLLFAAVQPFAGAWMGGDGVGRLPPGRRPVLLVHGYMCNRGLWWWLRRRLRVQGIAVATVDLEPPLAGIDQFAEALHGRIEQLVAETGADRVDIVAHSMGGLAARAYLRRYGTGRVARLVTLGTPHRGTRLAYLGPGRNAREMQPDSPWLRLLDAAGPSPVRTACIWSTHDEIVAPQDSGRLAGAREFVVHGRGHLALAFSPAVAAIVVGELTAAE